MNRVLVTSVLSIAVLIAPAIGGEISDTEKGYRFTLPDNWESQKNPIVGIAISVRSPDRKETGGNCNVVAVEDEATKELTQSELDARLSTEITEEFWKAMLANVKGLKSTKIDKSGNRDQRGRKVFFLKATSEYAAGEKSLVATQLIDVHAVPGRGYMVTCTALAEQFDREASNFDAIMTSFEPLPQTFLTVRAPLPWVVTRAGHARALAQAASQSVDSGAFVAKAR